MVFFDTLENLVFKAVEDLIFFIRNTNVTRVSLWLSTSYSESKFRSKCMYIRKTGGLKEKKNIGYCHKQLNKGGFCYWKIRLYIVQILKLN